MTEKKIVTGRESFNYIRKQLDIGISLSKCINQLSIENGKVFSFVPKGTTDKNLYNFDLGGIYPFNKEELKSTNLIPIRNDARIIILNEIENHINANRTNCCLFENPNASPKFPWVEASGMQYVHLNNEEMFFFFNKECANIENVDDAFSTSETYMFLCALSSLNSNDHFYFSSFKEINISLLELFVEKLSSFYLKAYDGEGYLMWCK